MVAFYRHHSLLGIHCFGTSNQHQACGGKAASIIFGGNSFVVNEDYKKTCENGGEGKYAELYADFGDVHKGSFREWWTKNDRGARLFGEPPLPNDVVALTPEEISALPEDWRTGALLVVAIPLSLRKRLIQQKLSKILARHHKRKRGQRTFKESRALYPIATQFRIHSLKRMLELYDLRQKEPNLTLWEIGQRFRLGAALTKDELKVRGRDAAL